MSAAYVRLLREMPDDTNRRDDDHTRGDSKQASGSGHSPFPSVDSVLSDIEKRCKIHGLVA